MRTAVITENKLYVNSIERHLTFITKNSLMLKKHIVFDKTRSLKTLIDWVDNYAYVCFDLILCGKRECGEI